MTQVVLEPNYAMLGRRCCSIRVTVVVQSWSILSAISLVDCRVPASRIVLANLQSSRFGGYLRSVGA